MKRSLRYELYRLIYSYALIYACLICVPLACVTNFVVAGAPDSPLVYGLAFEFFIPQILVVTVPAVYIVGGQRKGRVKTELLCGEKRSKIFISKSIVYYLALFVVFNVYLLILTLMNAQGVGSQTINGENSFAYFLRCASIGFAYCFMLSTVLLFISVLFRNSLITAAGGLFLFLIEFILKSVVDWSIADRVIPSYMIEHRSNNGFIYYRGIYVYGYIRFRFILYRCYVSLL